MKSNKKGIMIKFLTTVLLAILIFAPACYVASKFFRLSDQAKDNFVNFVDAVKKFEQAGSDERRTALLILDEGTAIMFFEPYQTEIKVNVDAEFPNTDYTIVIKNPQRCPTEKGCLCLFREPDFDITMLKPGYDTVTVTEDSPLCQELDSVLKLDSCSIGHPNDVNSYTCTTGFMIERHLADESSWLAGSYYEVPRRSQISLAKKGDYVLLSKNE